ncbi:MAG: hypothetical protein F6K42_12995 [Leptolyngbya sp. SIO1D8]|nr:hypothetical protein [Leptolyngbya sp. SIO1D8]
MAESVAKAKNRFDIWLNNFYSELVTWYSGVTGKPEGEVRRDALERGLTAMVNELTEIQNRQRVAKKLVQRQGRMHGAVEALEIELGENHPQLKILREELSN